jgi:hypothetical protein
VNKRSHDLEHSLQLSELPHATVLTSNPMLNILLNLAFYLESLYPRYRVLLEIFVLIWLVRSMKHVKWEEWRLLGCYTVWLL